MLVNDKPVSVASREVTAADHIAIVGAHPEVHVLRMTDEWIAVNKATGIAVQPVRDRSRRSLQEILGVQLKRSGVPHDLYVVHRIDTGTSGVVLFARNQAAAARLSELFAARAVRKIYVALVAGEVEPGVFRAPIEGKPAETIVESATKTAAGTRIEVAITTGRTHQIRIHLSAAGHPVAGDRRYGSATSSSRLMLHAWKLEHPSFGEIEAPVPPEFL